mgnify:CR=1 FL=1
MPTKAETRRPGSPERNPKKGRPRRQRCPNCKKLRMKWFLANNHHRGRQMWGRLVEGGPKVCHLCIERAGISPGEGSVDEAERKLGEAKK